MKKFLILALSAALLTAFFGCGSPKEPEPLGPPSGTEDFEEIFFEPLPTPDKKANDATGENNSNLYKFTGDDFTKIQKAIKGSYLLVKYSATVNYAVGEIGWIDIANAGPVIIGDATGKTQQAIIYVEDLVLGTDNFTIHIFNGATLKEVTLYAAPDDYVPTPNANATAGAKRIFIPSGHPVPGNGDLSKADFKKITEAASGSTLVFYFEKSTAPDDGILKFGPKSGNPYKHYGISKDGVSVDGDAGWRVYTAGEEEGKGTITYNVADIKAGLTAAAADFPTGKFNKLEINQGSKAKADLVYIELKP